MLQASSSRCVPSHLVLTFQLLLEDLHILTFTVNKYCNIQNITSEKLHNLTYPLENGSPLTLKLFNDQFSTQAILLLGQPSYRTQLLLSALNNHLKKGAYSVTPKKWRIQYTPLQRLTAYQLIVRRT